MIQNYIDGEKGKIGKKWQLLTEYSPNRNAISANNNKYFTQSSHENAAQFGKIGRGTRFELWRERIPPSGKQEGGPSEIQS
jgi:hypothetical protein